MEIGEGERQLCKKCWDICEKRFRSLIYCRMEIKLRLGYPAARIQVVLLRGSYMLKRFIGINYDIVAITLDPGFNGIQGDYSSIAQLCEEMDIPYILKRTQIGEIVFDVRQETSPCSLCARMRRELCTIRQLMRDVIKSRWGTIMMTPWKLL